MMKRFLPIILIALLSITTGCKSTKLAYFNDLEDVKDLTISVEDRSILIQPHDELMINVTASVQEAVDIYNLPLATPALTTDIIETSSRSYQQTYLVNKEGYITFPILGKIKAAGLTTQQLADELTRLIAVDVEAPFVRVELVNFKVKVLGEVQKPGLYRMSTEHVSILDALAEAGDLSVFARRDNIVIIREEEDGLKFHRMDLTDSNLFKSPYYFLKQNDVIYVEPGSARRGQADFNQNNSYKVSVISAVVSGVSVVVSLIIALVK